MHAWLRRIVVPAAIVVVTPVYAFDMPATQVSMEVCLQAAQAKVSGQVTNLKLEIEAGKPLYEFKANGQARQKWEIECDANTGQLLEVERKVDRNDQELLAAAKIVESKAREIVLQRIAGKVSSSERAIAEGRPTYEIEIAAADGKAMEVKVDAATGEIVSIENESEEKTVYEIGQE
ncbi:MAG TPA: PepSY domain-containing protein [Burkholderiales bacterium]|nr:PepSY domain-containing protein [Burkholderiales bacterium]